MSNNLDLFPVVFGMLLAKITSLLVISDPGDCLKCALHD